MSVDLPRITPLAYTKLYSNTVDPVVAPYVCMYGHTYSKSMDQPGKVANPARGHLISVLCVSSPFILDAMFVWVYQPESHRRKATQDFHAACLYFSRGGFSRSFPSSTVKSKFEICVLTI